MTGWHFDPRDTADQRRILRRSESAQRVRVRFAPGTRVRARHASTEELGTVERHIPGSNAQGGYLLIKWDRSDRLGRHGPITVEPLVKEGAV